MNKERALLHDFYSAFKRRDAETMASCYHQEIEFSDPVFGTLTKKEPAMMWKMLLERSKNSEMDIVYRLMDCDADKATVEWEARYEFSNKKRKVHNKIISSIIFKDGKIYRHHDSFDFYKWSSMALGFKGALLGWTSFFQNKVKEEVRTKLKKFIDVKQIKV